MTTTAPNLILEVGDLKLDRLARTVRVSGRLIDLRATEYALLEQLLLARGKVVKRRQLARRISNSMKESTVLVHMCSLRQRLGDFSDDLITTVRGKGYLIK